MYLEFLFDTTELVQTLFQVIVTVMVIQLGVYLILSQSLSAAKDPYELGKSIFCYIMLTIGVLMMSSAIIPTLTSVLSSRTLSAEVYTGLLLVFAGGGLIFLWYENRLQELAEDAKRLPRVLYIFSMKVIGQLSLALAVLYITLAVTTDGLNSPGGQWSVALTLVIYGALMSALTTTVEDLAEDNAKKSLLKKAPAKSRGRPKKKK